MFRFAALTCLSALMLFTAPAVAGEPGPDEAAEGWSPMRLRSIAAGTGVKQRVLHGQADEFTADGAPVWVHVAVSNPGPASHVTMVWYLEDEEIWQMDVKVGTSPRWRTWTRMRMPLSRTGQWRVEVHDPAGNVLGDVLFDVSGGAPAPVAPAVGEDAPVERTCLPGDQRHAAAVTPTLAGRDTRPARRDPAA